MTANTQIEDSEPFDQAFSQAVDLGNQIADDDDKADLWDIADGLLAGAIQFWLYSRQPCDDPRCENCAEVSTADLRMRKLMEEAKRWAEDSTYYQTPFDVNVGRA